jgi:uncharacterized protein YfaS (alpha-2-macroglobulin family)
MKSTALLRILSLVLGALLCIGLLAASVTQEVPYGGLHVVVTMKENGKLLPHAEVTLQLLYGDKSSKEFHHFRTKDGLIDVSKLPAGAYSIEADARAHSAKRRSIYIDEGKVQNVDLQLEPKDPELELYASQRVFSPGEKASFEIHGFDPAKSATVNYYRLDLGKVVAKGGLTTLLYSFSRPGNEGASDPAKSSTLSEKFEKPLTSKDIEGVFSEAINLPALDEGFYYVTCHVGKQSKATYLNVSKIGLVTKTSGRDTLCFVTDIVSGKPIEGATIQAPGGSGLIQVASTDKFGLARVTVPANDLKKALLLASSGKSQAVLDFDNEVGKNRQARMFIYADRPIYRPGDTVHFKGIVRNLNGLAYSVPRTGQVAIEILDAEETATQKLTLPITAKGTFDGTFKTNIEDNPGNYGIKATYSGAEYTKYVNVAEYRKPEFSIKVEPTKKYFVYGDRASAKVKAEYYFGGPVVGAKVEGFVTRRPHYDYSGEMYDDEYASDEESGGDAYYNREFVGQFDEKVEATTNEKGEAILTFDTKAENDPEVADYDLDFSIDASITDASKKSVDATGSVMVVRGDVSAQFSVDHYIADPGETVSASMKIKRQDNGAPVVGRAVTIVVGTEKWNDTKSEFIPTQTLTGQTDAKGVATIPIMVGKEGSLLLKASVKDDAGRDVKATAYLYVEGDTTSGPPVAKFTLTLDKKSYRIGEKCKIIVETDKPGGAALITIQAEKVLSNYVVNLTKQSTVVTIPVLHDYSPNVWVSAVATKNKHFLEAQSKLVVATKEHDLKVTVTPDRADYQPGQVANLTIKTTDSEGKPVPADLSVGVVDESIYAIQPDTTNIKKGFYPMRSDNVRTNYSFEEIYLDGGDKAGGNIPVRTDFKDTAAWLPTVESDATGTAHTSVKLPDNLTSWRATAIGVTDATQVGMTTTNFRARKPLTVRLELPSFLVQKDTQKITAIVTNDTGQDQDVNIRLEAQGVTVGGQLSQKIHVSAAKPQALTWEVETPNSGVGQFKAMAWIDGGAQDAEGRSVVIEPHGRLVTESKGGEIANNSSVTFNVLPTADRNAGRLALTISPSIGTTIYQSLDELIDFPYGCTEQTMSRFLPTVLLASTLKELNLRSDLEAKVPAIVDNGFARLAKMQHGNGAWGWWEYDEQDMFMTAYVLDGLKRAKAAGYSTDKINEDQALNWAKTQLKGAVLTKYNVRDFLYLCYAASLYGVKDEVREGIKRAKATDASDFALLAMTYHQLGDVAARDEALSSLHVLINAAGNIARLSGEPWEYGVERIAFPLIALTTIAPQDPFIPKLVRYLMVSRQGDKWNSTRDSSLALVGLTQYMKSTRDNGKPVDIDVVLNGGTPRHVHFDPADQFSPSLKFSIAMIDLKPGENKVEFRSTGSNGLCYFGGDLKQYDVADELLPLRDTVGLSVTRNYYLLEPQRLENGSMELRPSKRSIDQAASGDIIRVELVINSSIEREFIMIEDPIPSGCRITEREYVDDVSGESWSNWWSQTIVRDDKAAFFLRNLPKGRGVLTYTMRAEQIGVGHALPTTMVNMYDPSQSASGGESLLKIGE